MIPGSGKTSPGISKIEDDMRVFGIKATIIFPITIIKGCSLAVKF
ncbi:hypothetical protein LCGC14_2487230, partial [marine sediment metagenome]